MPTDRERRLRELMQPPKPVVLDLDANPLNADWTKRSWDIPASTVEELRAWIKASGRTVEEFKRLPVYRWNVARMPRLRCL
jgi:hypothetical protein